jgi:hypothetical protein
MKSNQFRVVQFYCKENCFHSDIYGLSFVLKMSMPKRKRNLLDFRQKREIVEIKKPTNNETWEAARHRYIGKCT